jgi:hypothetical protein
MEIKSEKTRTTVFVIVTAIAVAAFAYTRIGNQSVFLLIFLPAGLITAYAIFFARDLCRKWWRARSRVQQAVTVILAFLSLWLLLFSLGKTPDRILDATIPTAALLLLWGGYRAFSSIVDALWGRIHRRI